MKNYKKFSLFQQKHDGEHGLYNYVTFTLWISSIYSIQDIVDTNAITYIDTNVITYIDTNAITYIDTNAITYIDTNAITYIDISNNITNDNQIIDNQIIDNQIIDNQIIDNQIIDILPTHSYWNINYLLDITLLNEIKQILYSKYNSKYNL